MAPFDSNHTLPSDESKAGGLLTAALAYAKQGIPVFPLHSTDGHGNCTCSERVCSNPGKHPRTIHGLSDGTTNELVIRQWWRRWPDANIGLRTGVRFVVLDPDDGDAGLVEAQAFDVDLDGPHSVTGNGRHYLFRLPDGVTLRSKVKLTGDWPLEHCDTRAEGGYIVAPPSRHYHGKHYRWSASLDVDRIPDVPEKLLAVWRDADDDPRNADPFASDDDATGPDGLDDGEAQAGDAQGEVTATYYVRKYTDGILQHETAGRNQTGVYLACQLRDNGISLEGAPVYMRQYQRAVEHARPRKAQYTWDEAERTLKSIYSRPARKASPVELTEPGGLLWAVERFVRQYGEQLRYAALFDRWYEHNGRWWVPAEEEVAKRKGTELATGLYRAAALEPDRKRRDALAELAHKVDSERKLSAMVSFARAQKPLSVTRDELDPDDWKVVAANGLVDLRTGALLPHNPRVLHTRHLGPTLASLVYDPEARCPAWLEFLTTIFQGDTDLVAYLQRAAGYTLTGDTSEQVWFPLFGDGNNGKSTMTQALRAVLGTYADTLPAKSLLVSRYDAIPADLAKLVGVRGVFASETPEGRQLDVNAIKQWTGGEPIDARFMRQNWFAYQPKFKLWLHTNHKPIIRDTTEATWRRIRPIPFRYRVPDADLDKHFYERVLLPELPGILAWMVEGCLAWQRDRLGMPEIVRQERESYRAESDATATFLDEHLYAEPQSTVRSGTVYEMYVEWCKRRREPAGSPKALSRAVKERFGVEPTKDGKGLMQFRGLALEPLDAPLW